MPCRRECGSGPTLFLFTDQLTESCLGIGAGGDVLLGEGLGLLTLLLQRRREGIGLLALGLQVLAFVLEVVDQRIELIGRHRACAQGHP